VVAHVVLFGLFVNRLTGQTYLSSNTQGFSLTMSSLSSSSFDQLEQQWRLLREQEHAGSVITALLVVAVTYILYNVSFLE
jgi:hypothetical protein